MQSSAALPSKKSKLKLLVDQGDFNGIETLITQDELKSSETSLLHQEIEAGTEENLATIEAILEKFPKFIKIKDRKYKSTLLFYFLMKTEYRKPLHIKRILNFIRSLIKAATNEGMLKEMVNTPYAEGCTAVHLAVLNGEIDIVRLLIDEAGADLRAQDKEGNTLLIFAFIKGQFEIAKLIASKNPACIDIRNHVGQTVINLAKSANQRGLTDFFLQLKISSTKSEPKSINDVSEMKSPLMQEVNELKAREKVRATNPSLIPYLHEKICRKSNHKAIINILERYPEFIQIVDNENNNLLFLFINNPATREVLSPLDQLAFFKILTSAASKVMISESESVLAMKNASNNSILYCAIVAGLIDFVRHLVYETDISLTDFNSVDGLGDSPYAVALMSGQFAIAELLLETDKINASRALLKSSKTAKEEKDTDKEAQEEQEELSPLHEAVQRNDLATLQQLVSVFAMDCAELDKDGNTPLHRAFKLGHYEIAKFLVDTNPACLGIKNKEPLLGSTPLFIFVSLTSVRDKIPRHQQNLILKTLIEKSAAVKVDDKETALTTLCAKGFNVLHKSAELNDKDFVELLIIHGNMNVNLTSKEIIKTEYIYTQTSEHKIVCSAPSTVVNRTAFKISTDAGHKALAFFILSQLNREVKQASTLVLTDEMRQAVIDGNSQLFAELKGNPNAVDEQGFTPLLIAVERRNLKFVKWLLLHGADVSTICMGRFNAFHASLQNGDMDIAQHLFDHMSSQQQIESLKSASGEFILKVLRDIIRINNLPLLKDILHCLKIAKPNLAWWKQIKKHSSPLLCACICSNFAIAEFILDQMPAKEKPKIVNELVKVKNKNYDSLYYAIKAGKLNLVEKLVSAGADFTRRVGKYEIDAIIWAVYYRSWDVADFILDKIADQKLFKTINTSRMQNLGEFSNLPTVENGNLLHLVIHLCHYSSLPKVANADDDEEDEVNEIDKDPSYHFLSNLFEKISNYDTSIFSQRNILNQTPLETALILNNPHIAFLIFVNLPLALRKQALKIKLQNSQTILHFAARHNFDLLIRAALEVGADIFSLDGKGKKASDLATDDMVKNYLGSVEAQRKSSESKASVSAGIAAKKAAKNAKKREKRKKTSQPSTIASTPMASASESTPAQTSTPLTNPVRSKKQRQKAKEIKEADQASAKVNTPIQSSMVSQSDISPEPQADALIDTVLNPTNTIDTDKPQSSIQPDKKEQPQVTQEQPQVIQEQQKNEEKKSVENPITQKASTPAPLEQKTFDWSKLIKEVSELELNTAAEHLRALDLLSLTSTEELTAEQEKIRKFFPMAFFLPDQYHTKITQLLNIIKQCITQEPGAAKFEIILTGSFVKNTVVEIVSMLLQRPKGDHAPNNDIDIRIVGNCKIDWTKVKELCNQHKLEIEDTLSDKLHKIKINGMPVDIFQDIRSKSSEESVRACDLITNTLIAVWKSPSFIATDYLNAFAHSILKVNDVTDQLMSPTLWVQTWAEESAKGNPESPSYIMRFFNLMKSLIKNIKITKALLKEILAITTQIEKSLEDKSVVSYTLSFLNKLMLNGQCEKFLKILSACNAVQVIFPFLNINQDSLNNPYILDLVTNTDYRYLRFKNRTEHETHLKKPSLRFILLRFAITSLKVSEGDLPIEKQIPIILEIIKQNPLLATLFSTVDSEQEKRLNTQISIALYQLKTFKLGSKPSTGPTRPGQKATREYKIHPAIKNSKHTATFSAPNATSIPIGTLDHISLHSVDCKAMSFLKFLSESKEDKQRSFANELIGSINTSAREQSPHSQYLLALYLFNKGDLRNALGYCTASAQRGYSFAQYRLSQYFVSSNDIVLAGAWHRCAVTNGFSMKPVQQTPKDEKSSLQQIIKQIIDLFNEGGLLCKLGYINQAVLKYQSVIQVIQLKLQGVHVNKDTHDLIALVENFSCLFVAIDVRKFPALINAIEIFKQMSEKLQPKVFASSDLGVFKKAQGLQGSALVQQPSRLGTPI